MSDLTQPDSASQNALGLGVQLQLATRLGDALDETAHMSVDAYHDVLLQVLALALNRGPLTRDMTLLQFYTVLAFPFTLQETHHGTVAATCCDSAYRLLAFQFSS